MTLRTSWRRRSRAFRILTGTAAILAAVVLLLWIARASLTEWAIENSIDGFGLGPSDIRVTDLGLARAEMSLVSSAAGTIDHIHVEYGLGDLLSGEVRRMTVEGARLRFAWKDGRLVPAITPSDGPIVLPLERLDIRNSTLTLDLDGQEIVADMAGTVTGKDAIAADMALSVRAPQGRMNGRIAGTMTPGGALDGTFTVTGGDLTVGAVKAETLTGALRLVTGVQGIELIDGAFGFEQISSGAGPLGPGRLAASLRQPANLLAVELKSKPVSFTLAADGGAPAKGVPFTMDGTADAGFLGGLAGAVKQADGAVTLKAAGTAPPAASMQAAFASGLGDWLRHGKAEGALTGNIAKLDIPDTVAVGDAALSLEIRLADGALAVTTPKGITVSGMMLDPSIAAKDGMFAGNSSLSLAPAPGAPFLAITPGEPADKLTLSGGISYETPTLFVRGDVTGDATLDPAQWQTSAGNLTATGDVTLKAQLALKLPDDRSLPSAELAMNAKYNVGPAKAQVTVGSGALTVRNAHWGEAFALPGTSRVVLQPGAIYAKDRATGAVEATAVLQPFVWNATMKRDGAEPGKVTVAAGRMALTMGKDGLKAALEKGRVEMPDSGVAARGISATVSKAGDATDIRAAIADLRGTGEPALFSSLKASLDARIAGSKATFSGGVSGWGKRLALTAKGTHDLDTGKGGASFALKPIDLADDGTLEALSPKLAASVAKASGTISGDGAVHWGENAAPGTLTVALKDVALSGESVNVTALNGGVRLDSLSPMRTAAGQRLAGTLKLATVDQMPFDVTFRLEPGKLVLERATARVFEGEFATENAEIDTATGEGRIDLKVSDVNIETAFAVLDLEQLKGTGRIGGMLPLRLQGGKVAVENGHLESSMPGTLQVGVTALADQLKTYGENVDMAFRALTDFHYDRMVIDADKPFSGAGKAMFRLEGNNPAVMEGQPFVFNISLETDFDYLTNLLLELSGAANTALGWGARELTKK